MGIPKMKMPPPVDLVNIPVDFIGRRDSACHKEGAGLGF